MTSEVVIDEDRWRQQDVAAELSIETYWLHLPERNPKYVSFWARDDGNQTVMYKPGVLQLSVQKVSLIL